MNRRLLLLPACLLLVGLVSAGCESQPAAKDADLDSPKLQKQMAQVKPATKADPVRDHAYALLYGLMKNESQVGGILKIKSTSKPVTDVINDIQAASKATLDMIEKLNPAPADGENKKLTQTGLPQAEQDVRSSIQTATTGQLLFSSGDKFQQRLLITQIEATNYAVHLAKVIAKNDDRKEAQQAMEDVQAKFQKLHDRVAALLVLAPDARLDKSADAGTSEADAHGKSDS